MTVTANTMLLLWRLREARRLRETILGRQERLRGSLPQWALAPLRLVGLTRLRSTSSRAIAPTQNGRRRSTRSGASSNGWTSRSRNLRMPSWTRRAVRWPGSRPCSTWRSRGYALGRRVIRTALSKAMIAPAPGAPRRCRRGPGRAAGAGPSPSWLTGRRDSGEPDPPGSPVAAALTRLPLMRRPETRSRRDRTRQPSAQVQAARPERGKLKRPSPNPGWVRRVRLTSACMSEWWPALGLAASDPAARTDP